MFTQRLQCRSVLLMFAIVVDVHGSLPRLDNKRRRLEGLCFLDATYLADFHPTVQRNRCVRVVRIGDPGPAEHVDEHLLAVDGLLLDAHVRLGRVLEGSGRSGPSVWEVVLDSIDG